MIGCFCYRHIYRSRLSDRSKKIPKCFSDRYLTQEKDIRVIEYDLKHKAASRNAYIGVYVARRIICTYYDTPPQHFGAYHFFLIERRKGRQTMNFILVSSFIPMGIGAVAITVL